MPTRRGLPLCLVSIDMPVPPKSTARFPPRMANKLPRVNRDWSKPSLRSLSGNGKEMVKPDSKKKRQESKVSVVNNDNTLISSSKEEAAVEPVGCGGTLSNSCNQQQAFQSTGPIDVRPESEVRSTSELMSISEVRSTRASQFYSCVPNPTDWQSAAPSSPSSSTTSSTTSENNVFSHDTDDACNLESEGESEGEEEVEVQFGSSVTRHRLALTLEMAELDRLRSALRDRELQWSLREELQQPIGGGGGLHPNNRPSHAGVPSTFPLIASWQLPVDRPAVQSQHTERALDIIRAGLSDTSPLKWGDSWQGWGAKAA